MDEERIGDRLRRLVFQGSRERRECSHLDAVRRTDPESLECRGCIEEGTRAVHLRMCLTCGEVACCDSSKAKHARRHHESTGHPLIRAIEPGEEWAWCYPDRAYLVRVPSASGDPETGREAAGSSERRPDGTVTNHGERNSHGPRAHR